MPTLQANYFTASWSLNLTRDVDGVLVVEFHSNGGPFISTGQDHTEFLDAFYQIAEDRTNKIVVLTGTGGEFIPDINFSSFGNVAGRAAIEGHANVHSEYALLANVIVAGEGATLNDVPHFAVNYSSDREDAERVVQEIINDGGKANRGHGRLVQGRRCRATAQRSGFRVRKTGHSG
jgi:hypothetical protein